MSLQLSPVGRLGAIAAYATMILLAPGDSQAQAPSARIVTGATPCAPQGLTPSERRLIFDAVQSGDEPTEAPIGKIDDDGLTAALKRHATVQLGQRLRPAQVDRMWALAPPLRDVASELSVAKASGQLAQWLSALEPPHPAYHRLEIERCVYRNIVDGGGWQPLPPGPALREGDRHTGVAALRVRLRIEGYDPPPFEPADQLDAGLAAQLRTFQRRHDLEEDAILGRETRAALDVSAEQRLLQLEANLERWRWLPHALPGDRLELDVGAAEAVLYRTGKPQLSMRVIVGDSQHRTPMFASRLEAVVFNPPWNVPASIATNEILPRLARDPGYLARNHFIRTPQGLQQRPGPDNALGQVKFDLPSPFGVYLHDTPGRSAFQRRVRTLSHGCMRLEKPRELAEALLAAQGWDHAAVEGAITEGQTRRVELENPLPLFVVYRTVWPDTAGWVKFGRDPYGWDMKLVTALAGSQPRPATNPTDSECSASSR